ncbi:MAG: SusC/RagA family TonB-linked outer membrane protein [Salinibacter sp.]
MSICSVLVILGGTVFCPNVLGQQGTIAGTVIDSTTGEALPGVNVIVVGTQQGTTTDSEGNYQITGVEPGTYTLRATFVGYNDGNREVEVEAGETTTVDFSLTPGGVELQNVVVTALGVERQERALSYSRQEVGGAELTKAPELNVAASLSGEVAGLSVSQSGSGVGSDARLLIRGNRSITGNSQPLIVVDGVPIRGDLSTISSYNIKSVEVLKGPNAAALYGSQAQNGAIIIQTEEAEEGEVGFSFTQNVMARDPVLPYDFQNTYGQGSAGEYDRGSEGSWGPRMKGQMVQHWSPAPELRNTEYAFEPQPDNVEDVYQTGYTSSTNFTTRIGSEDVQSLFGYTFTRASGTTPENRLTRHNVLVNTTAQPTPNLSVTGKLSYNREVIENGLPTGNSQGNATKLALLMPRNIRTEQAENFSYVDQDGVERQNFWNPGTIGSGNPYWAIHRNLSETITNRIIAQGSATYDFTDYLSLQVRGQVDNGGIQNEQRLYFDTFTSAPLGEYDVGRTNDLEWNGDFLLNYTQDVLSEFSIDANFGGSIRYEKGSTMSAQTGGNGLTIPNFFSLSNTRNVQASENLSVRREVQSLYGSGTISWSEAVFLKLTGRNDWSSTLPPGNRSFFYPSVGLSTVLTDLVPDVWPEAVDFAKIRGSWSQVGNSAPPFRTKRTANFRRGGRNGFLSFSSVLPADDLKPEQTESWEVGANIRTFGERLGLDLTYYHTTTKNQLFTVELPSGTGASRKFTNGGNVRNKGWEATLSVTPVQTPDFSWDMQVNWSRNESLVKSISDRRPSVVIGSSFMHELRVEQGEPFGEIYTVGFRRDDQGRVIVGQNGVPLSTSGFDVNAGNFNPDWEGGVSATFSYKGLSLSFLIDHRQGGEMAAFTSSRLVAAGVTERTLKGREDGLVFGEDIFPGETAVTQDGSPNDISVSAERLWTQIGGRESSIGEVFVEDATNTQLRELSITYSLPESVLSQVPVSSASLSVVGRNLLFLYRASDRINPNFLTGTGSGAQGFNSFAPPTPRSVGFNLNINY